MGVHTSISLSAREVLIEDDIDKLSEWLVFRARQTGNSQHVLVKRKDLLHQACELGASRCARYIVDLFPLVVNMQDRAGRSALQCALLNNVTDKAHYSCAYALLESDAAFNKLAFETREGSILHEICAECDSPDHAKVVKMVLHRAGRKITKNLINHNGDTPLHSLFRLNKLHDHIFSGDSPKTVTSDPSFLQKYFAVLRVCAELLLSKGCDPNKANAQGQTVLSMLLAHGHHFKGKLSLAGCPKIFSAYIRGINWVMEVLLKFGANPNEAGSANDVPLVAYVKTLQRCDQFGTVSKDIVNGLRLLCQNGADPNVACKNDKREDRRTKSSCFRTILTTSFSHCLRHCRHQACETSIISFLRESYHILRSHGLKPDTVLTHDLGLLLNFLCMNRFPLEPEFVAEFRDLLKDILMTGGDPNLIPLLSGPGVVPGHSVPTNIASAVRMHARNENVDMMEIVHVFYCSLDQTNLNTLTKEIIQELEPNNPGTLSQNIVTELVELTKQPRGLQELSRVAVHKAVGWKLAENADEVKLPHVLKRYLLDLD